MTHSIYSSMARLVAAVEAVRCCLAPGGSAPAGCRPRSHRRRPGGHRRPQLLGAKKIRQRLEKIGERTAGDMGPGFVLDADPAVAAIRRNRANVGSVNGFGRSFHGRWPRNRGIPRWAVALLDASRLPRG